MNKDFIEHMFTTFDWDKVPDCGYSYIVDDLMVEVRYLSGHGVYDIKVCKVVDSYYESVHLKEHYTIDTSVLTGHKSEVELDLMISDVSKSYIARSNTINFTNMYLPHSIFSISFTDKKFGELWKDNFYVKVVLPIRYESCVIRNINMRYNNNSYSNCLYE